MACDMRSQPRSETKKKLFGSQNVIYITGPFVACFQLKTRLYAMNRIFSFLSLALLPALLLSTPCRAQQNTPATPELAFAGGEHLVYAVSYKMGMVNSDVAEVVINTSLQQVGQRTLYRIEGTGKTHSFFNWFFDLNDTYISRLDATSLRPADLQVEIREGTYRVSQRYQYDWAARQVTTSHYNHKRADTSRHTMSLTDGSFDALALFFNLRCQNIESFTPGENRTLNLVLTDTIRTIRYSFVKRENKTIKGLGKFRTLRFVCQLATSSGESFEDGSEFTLWISDDANKIPIYIESPIRVGSIRGRLINAEKLKYPLESMIK